MYFHVTYFNQLKNIFYYSEVNIDICTYMEFHTCDLPYKITWVPRIWNVLDCSFSVAVLSSPAWTTSLAFSPLSVLPDKRFIKKDESDTIDSRFELKLDELDAESTTVTNEEDHVWPSNADNEILPECRTEADTTFKISVHFRRSESVYAAKWTSTVLESVDCSNWTPVITNEFSRSLISVRLCSSYFGDVFSKLKDFKRTSSLLSS